jgi:glycosyltransferase involved in cell wall biosynthesis
MTSVEFRGKLLYFAPVTGGGLADYAREQANALARLGVKVEMVSGDDFPVQVGDSFNLLPVLTAKTRGKPRLLKRLAGARRIMQDWNQLAHIIEAGGCRHVLLGSYAEYLAPLWSGRLIRLAERGVVFGAVVHDPVRDYVVGPEWWHRRSIASAYSFLREAFVHEPVTLDTVRPMPSLCTTVIPHGIYSFPPATAARRRFRLELGIPDAASLWLSFGHVRDGKNLDLVIRALAHFPDAFLLVAGKEQSSGQKTVAFYQELARQCGVDSRCRWQNRFIAAGEVGNLFEAADLVLLTYSKNFRSASGVLNTAVHFRKPCLVSSGQGNLQTMVSQYDLGIWLEPDRLETLIEGLRRWQLSPPAPRWQAYEANNSWQHNAEIVVSRMFGQRAWQRV